MDMKELDEQMGLVTHCQRCESSAPFGRLGAASL